MSQQKILSKKKKKKKRKVRDLGPACGWVVKRGLPAPPLSVAHFPAAASAASTASAAAAVDADADDLGSLSCVRSRMPVTLRDPGPRCAH